MLLSFYHTCASDQHHLLHRESLLCFHFHILVGIFHYRTWIVYSNDGLPQNALGLREQESWMHTHLVSFVEISYIYSSSASVAWQSLLLALTSIDGHLRSPLISRVDVTLSSFLVGFFGLFFIWASLASFIFHKVWSLIPTCGGIIVSIILSSLGQCSNNDDHHTFLYLQLNITTRYQNKDMTLYECLRRCTRMCNDLMQQ